MMAALDDGAAASLYQKLFAPFESQLANATTIYVAPDGTLNFVPFARLKFADGRYWGERQQLRLLQSGRDLLRADPDNARPVGAGRHRLRKHRRRQEGCCGWVIYEDNTLVRSRLRAASRK